MNATLSKKGSLLMRLVDALTRVRFSFSFLAPEGYEDETGFHYGVEPAKQKIAWPPAN